MSHDQNFLEEKVGGRIIHIKIQPRSIKHKADAKELNCADDAPPLPIKASEKNVEITYSYSIEWKVRTSLSTLPYCLFLENRS